MECCEGCGRIDGPLEEYVLRSYLVEDEGGRYREYDIAIACTPCADAADKRLRDGTWTDPLDALQAGRET